ncbi:MAG: hypothetical protein K6E29_01975 [Cyanobacteria bacterium RUI128]|nr:hypothetical protein [Cyanobacteria bacterium RUI128]
MELSRVSRVSNNAVSMNKVNGALCKPNNCGLQADTVCFTGKKQKFDAEGKPKKSSVIHKALVSATGCFIPGMGQAINGQWGKAALFAIGAPIAVWGAMTVSLPLALGVGLAAEAGMFIDAYRNA